jgi:hypothetical protein
VRRTLAAVVAVAALCIAGFALAQEVFTVSVEGPSGTTTATDAAVTVSANGTAFFSCGINGTAVACGTIGTTGVATVTSLTLGAQTFNVLARSYHGKTEATNGLTWTVVAATSTTSTSSTTSATSTSTPTSTSTSVTSTGGRHEHRTSPFWYVLAGAGAAAVLGFAAVALRRGPRGPRVEIEVATEEPAGPCMGKGRRRHVKATLLPARRTIAYLVLQPGRGAEAKLAGELVDALNDAVRRYRHRGQRDEVRLVALPIAAGLRREIEERFEPGADEVPIGAHLEGGKLEVAHRLYGCVDGEWKPVGPEIRIEVADECDEPVATARRVAAAADEQRLVEQLAAFVTRVDVTEPKPVPPPRSALRSF